MLVPHLDRLTGLWKAELMGLFSASLPWDQAPSDKCPSYTHIYPFRASHLPRGHGTQVCHPFHSTGPFPGAPSGYPGREEEPGTVT